MRLDSSKNYLPYLVFDCVLTTHLYNLSSYFKTLTKEQENLHKIIFKLYKNGLGYRKISQKLNDMNIKISTGKAFYPTLVSITIQKIIKRDVFLDIDSEESINNFTLQLL